MYTYSIVREGIVLVVLARIPRVFYNHIPRTDPAPNHICVVLKSKHTIREGTRERVVEAHKNAVQKKHLENFDWKFLAF